jgi:aryl-alcohol dehydrogenase-like predicted oxidoreductase
VTLTLDTSNPLPAAARGRRQLADGLTVTRLGYGAMQLPGPGIWGPPQDRDAAIAVLRRAVDLGVTHIDTSHAYGPHVANQLIHQALHPYPADLVVATKVGVVRDQQRAFAAATTPADLRDQVERNLRGLGVDQLDLVYLRIGGDGLLVADGVPLAESLGALAELQARGLIRHLGLSGVTREQLAEAGQVAPAVAIQNRYHLLDRGSSQVLAACEQRDVAFVAYFPLGAGMLNPNLDTSQLPPGMGLTEQQQSTLGGVARRHGATWAQVALAWLLAHSPVTLAIPGTRSLAHLEENVAAAHVSLSEIDLAELDQLVGSA